MQISASQVNELRQRTGIGLMDAKKALIEVDGDMDAAVEALKAKGAAVADKKSTRETGQGIVESYIHANRIGVMVEVNCETDFVARNPEFKEFTHEVAMQIASMAPASVDALYEQPYVKDSSKTIRELRNGLVQKIGENVQIRRFIRYELGGEA
jgi:elongation factor Ts